MAIFSFGEKRSYSLAAGSRISFASAKVKGMTTANRLRTVISTRGQFGRCFVASIRFATNRSSSPRNLEGMRTETPATTWFGESSRRFLRNAANVGSFPTIPIDLDIDGFPPRAENIANRPPGKSLSFSPERAHCKIDPIGIDAKKSERRPLSIRAAVRGSTSLSFLCSRSTAPKEFLH